MKTNERIWFAAIVFIGLIYILLRLWHLTDLCLWFDEIFSIHAAEHDWQNLFRFVAQDLIHPPLFYVLLKIWIAIGGESLLWLRLFSVLFSTAALIPFYLFCRQLKLSFPVIASAFAFFAVNGALVKYAQEVRMYSVLLCLSLLSLWLFVRFFNLGKSFALLTIVNVLLIYTHYFSWLVVLSEFAAVLVLQRVKIRQISLMLAVSLASFAPWVFAVGQAAKTNANFSQNLAWASKPNFPTVLQFVFDLIEPFYFQRTSLNPASIYLITVPLLSVFVAAFAFYFANRKTETELEARNVSLLLILGLAPIIIAICASWLLPVSIWGTRHLIVIFAPLTVLTAFAINKSRNLYLKLVTLILIFWLTGMALLLEIRRGKPASILCAWENLAGVLREKELNSNTFPTKVFIFEDDVAYNFWFALRDKGSQFQIIKVNNIAGLTEDAAYFLPRGFDKIVLIDENGLQGERFFIAFREKKWDETKPPLKNLIEKDYKIGEPQIFEAQGLKAFLVEVKK